MIQEINLKHEAERIAQVVSQGKTGNSFVLIDKEFKKLREIFGEIPSGLLFHMVGSSLKKLTRQ